MSPPLLADLLLLYNVLELDINLCKVIDCNVFGPGMEWFGSRRAIIGTGQTTQPLCEKIS
jgi:hypothetical protein